MTAKIKKSDTQLSGKELGKKLIRQQIGEWFAKSRSMKERTMNNKSNPDPITQDQIDEHVKKFLEKGGKIQKLDPFNFIPEEEEENTDDEDLNDVNFGIKKSLFNKINEMRY